MRLKTDFPELFKGETRENTQKTLLNHHTMLCHHKLYQVIIILHEIKPQNFILFSV
jgi:hypothetical protein